MLSNRLNSILLQIEPCETLCDIGSDHALLAIEAIKQSIVDRVICVENKKGPFMRGLDNVKKHKLEDKIEVILSDGALNVTKQCDAWVIAGMGAETIIKIIEDSIDKAKQVKQLILQPQSKLPFFRKKMNEIGFLCKNETLLLDDKFYHVFSYHYQKDLLPISEREINIGFISLKKNPQLYLQWVKENILKLEPISKQSTENYVLYQYFNQELLSNQFLDMDVD